MRLDNDFVVPRPVDEAWDVLTDVQRIAPCMPGAQLGEIDGENYHGTVKVKVGPVVAQYAGVARFTELDATRHHAVLEAKGKERSGRGMASALVTADLTGDGDSTRVHVSTELTISGPLAQFGRGAITEVSAKLLGQFVDELENLLAADATPAEEPAAAVPEPAVEAAPVREVEAVDLLEAAWLPIVKRAVPALVAVVVLVAVLRWLLRRSSRQPL
jgi:carbon monoxide dehydrogenase subunit G